MKQVDKKTTAVGHLVAITYAPASTGTRTAHLAFRVDDGEFTGAVVRGRKHFTKNTWEQVEETFLAMGWDGQSDFTKLPLQRLQSKCILDIDLEEWTADDGVVRTSPVVNFVKPLLNVKGRLTSEEASDMFGDFMRDRGLATAGGGAPRRSYGRSSGSNGLPPSRRQDDDGGDDFAQEP